MVGIDVKLQLLPNGVYDITIAEDGDIASEDSLDTALITSLFTDARADASQVQQNERRRGWIGNENTPGFEVGSQLWLYEQARRNQNTFNDVSEETRSALEWLLTEGLADGLDINTRSLSGSIFLEVNINRGDSKIDKRLFEIYKNTGTN